MKYKFLKNLGIYLSLIAGILTVTSCEKELAEPTIDNTPVAYVAVHNFALLTGTTSSVFVNNTQLKIAANNVALGVGGSLFGNYIGVTPGAATVGLRTATGTTDFASRTINVANTSYTSFFAFDTLTTGGTARILALTNDMRAPDTAVANIRFLHLSPNAGPVNVVMTRTFNQFGLAATGTVNLTNIPFVGATAIPNEATLSVFSGAPAGTYTVVVTSGTTTLLTVPNVNLRERKNYSIVLRGFAPPRAAIPAGQTLGLSLLLHNP